MKRKKAKGGASRGDDGTHSVCNVCNARDDVWHQSIHLSILSF